MKHSLKKPHQEDYYNNYSEYKTDNMRTSFLSQQHCKCLNLLEMIQKCDEYITNCKNDLQQHHAKRYIDQMPGIEEWCNKQITKYRAIKQRLVQSYANQFMKIINQVEIPTLCSYS